MSPEDMRLEQTFQIVLSGIFLSWVASSFSWVAYLLYCIAKDSIGLHCFIFHIFRIFFIFPCFFFCQHLTIPWFMPSLPHPTPLLMFIVLVKCTTQSHLTPEYFIPTSFYLRIPEIIYENTCWNPALPKASTWLNGSLYITKISQNQKWNPLSILHYFPTSNTKLIIDFMPCLKLKQLIL